MTPIEPFVHAVNDQKGELMALECLVVSLLRAMPHETQAKVLAEFDRETCIGRGILRHFELPKDVAQGFDRYVEHLNKLRKDQPAEGAER